MPHTPPPPRHTSTPPAPAPQLTALEMGPANEMDITDNLLAEALPGPLLLRPAPQPDPRHLPMLHVAAPHHALDARHVRQVRHRCGSRPLMLVRASAIAPSTAADPAAASAARIPVATARLGCWRPPPMPSRSSHLRTQHLPLPPLSAGCALQALQFAGGTMYHALRNNCICFADFVVRVLTGGAVRGAPLIFDALVGQVGARQGRAVCAARQRMHSAALHSAAQHGRACIAQRSGAVPGSGAPCRGMPSCSSASLGCPPALLPRLPAPDRYSQAYHSPCLQNASPRCPRCPFALQVPVADSPLLALLELTMQMSWHDVCDGSRLLHAFLRQHPAGLPPPPAGSEALSILVEPAVPAEAGSETATETVAASAAPALPTLSALLGLLAPGALQAAGPGLSPLLAPASAPVPAVRPADSSSDSDVTVGGVERREETETDLAVPSPPSPSLGASLAAVSSSASTGSNGRARAGVRGLGLPPRKLKAAAGSAAGRG